MVKRSRPAATLRRIISLQARLVDRHAAALERRRSCRVDVEAQHVVADLGEAGAGDEADVAGPDHRDLQAGTSFGTDRALMAASAASGSARLRDRPPDHEVVGAGGDGRLGRDDPRLVVARRAGRTDAGRDQLEVAAAAPRAARRLMRRADDAVEAALLREAGEPQHLLVGRPCHARCRARSSAARLVSTVTAINSGGGASHLGGGLRSPPRAPRAASRGRPTAWTLIIHTPRRVAAAQACATVFGMS